MNVLNSACGIFGAILGGFTTAYMTLVSLYYGEEDREGLVDLFRYAIIGGLVAMVAACAVCSVFDGQLSAVFFAPQTRIWEIGRDMFLFGLWFFPINMVFNIFMNTYKAEGRMTLVNMMSFVETAFTGIIAFLTVPKGGTDAAWLANTWCDIFCMAVILISVFVFAKKISFAPQYLLKLARDFGAGEGEYAEYRISDVADVTSISDEVIKFCKGRGVDERKSFWAGLCVEELTRNILQHGGYKEKRNNVSVRVVYKEELTIRIQDDCRKFDPVQRMEMHTPESPESNIGLRMVAKAATSMDYYNNAGINSLIIKL